MYGYILLEQTISRISNVSLWNLYNIFWTFFFFLPCFLMRKMKKGNLFLQNHPKRNMFHFFAPSHSNFSRESESPPQKNMRWGFLKKNVQVYQPNLLIGFERRPSAPVSAPITTTANWRRKYILSSCKSSVYHHHRCRPKNGLLMIRRWN